MKKTITVILAFVLVLSISTVAFAGVDNNGWFTTRGDAPIPTFAAPSDPAVQAYWNQRHTYVQYEELFRYLANTYPQTVKLYSIGHTWEERTLWCLEISSDGKSAGKTPVSLVGNIHGGEQEGAECVAYTAWWLISGFAANNAEAVKALDGYVWYIIPVMNADGYERSMYSNTRQNMRPRGLGLDEYFDRSDDGKVGQMFAGSTATVAPYNGGSPNTSNWAVDFALDQITDSANNYLGYEAFDTNSDGRFGNSTKQSAIDLNRSFDYLWTLYRPANTSSTAAGFPLWGASGTWNATDTARNAGPGPASEPEVQAIQNFFTFNPPRAMITAHTGIQCVLYPWCYTPEPATDYAHMSATAEKMRAAFQDTVQTVRPRARYYQMQSYFDYPTAAEMIDWLYGRLGTHAYTVEVWSRGTGNATTSTNWDDTTWWNENFPARWTYLGQVRDGRSGNNARTYDNVWIYYSTTQIRNGEAPPDQFIMGEGFKNCALQMAFSEPAYSPHPGAPTWMTGAYGTEPEIIIPTATINFPGIKGVTVRYYSAATSWVTVPGTFDDMCRFILPEDVTITSISATKAGMSKQFDGLSARDSSIVLNVAVDTITVTGVDADCDLAIVQSDWVYQYAPATVGAPNVFKVFANDKPYEVRLYRAGFYPISIKGIDAGQEASFGPSYFYEVEAPAGVTNIWISSYDWAVRGANAGDKIVLICDPSSIKDAKLRYDSGGVTHNVDFKLDGSNPFI